MLKKQNRTLLDALVDLQDLPRRLQHLASSLEGDVSLGGNRTRLLTLLLLHLESTMMKTLQQLVGTTEGATETRQRTSRINTLNLHHVLLLHLFLSFQTLRRQRYKTLQLTGRLQHGMLTIQIRKTNFQPLLGCICIPSRSSIKANMLQTHPRGRSNEATSIGLVLLLPLLLLLLHSVVGRKGWGIPTG